MSKKICEYYKSGYCRFGDKCRNIHSKNDDIDMNQQNQTKFPTQKSNTCSFFMKNACNKGDKCPYFHGYCDRLQYVKTISYHLNEINNLVIMDNTKYISSDNQTFYVRFSSVQRKNLTYWELLVFLFV